MTQIKDFPKIDDIIVHLIILEKKLSLGTEMN